MIGPYGGRDLHHQTALQWIVFTASLTERDVWKMKYWRRRKSARPEFSFTAWVNWAEFCSANPWINNICQLLWQIIPASLEGTTGNCNSSPSSLYFCSCTFSFYKIRECKLWACGGETAWTEASLSAAYMPIPQHGFTCVFSPYFNFCTVSPADRKITLHCALIHFHFPSQLFSFATFIYLFDL